MDGSDEASLSIYRHPGWNPNSKPPPASTPLPCGDVGVRRRRRVLRRSRDCCSTRLPGSHPSQSPSSPDLSRNPSGGRRGGSGAESRRRQPTGAREAVEPAGAGGKRACRRVSARSQRGSGHAASARSLGGRPPAAPACRRGRGLAGTL